MWHAPYLVPLEEPICLRRHPGSKVHAKVRAAEVQGRISLVSTIQGQRPTDVVPALPRVLLKQARTPLLHLQEVALKLPLPRAAATQIRHAGAEIRCGLLPLPERIHRLPDLRSPTHLTPPLRLPVASPLLPPLNLLQRLASLL